MSCTWEEQRHQIHYSGTHSPTAMSEGNHAEDPFIDPSPPAPDSDGLLETDVTLLLECNSSLTLGVDSLIVLGKVRHGLAVAAIDEHIPDAY